MSWKSYILLFTCLVVQQSQAQFPSGFYDPPTEADFQKYYLNWPSNLQPGTREVWPPRLDRRRDTEIDDASVEKDREPLGPNYKDPVGSVGSSDIDPDVEPNTGVIDVDINGYPNQHGGFPSFSGAFPGFSGGFPGFGGNFPQVPNAPGSGVNTFGFGLNGFLSFLENYKRMQPWWKGPNVCIEREETIEDDEEKKDSTSEEDIESTFLAFINFSTCAQSPQTYECTTKTNNRGVIKTMIVRYKCCYGYRRTKYSDECVKVELKNLLDTIDMVKATEFRKMIQSSGLEDKLNENNYTIFVPKDRALNDFTEKMLEMNNVEINVDPVRRRRDLRHALTSRDLISNHIVSGFVDLADLDDEQLLNSEYQNSTIRINVYPTASSENLITANCIPITKPNNLAENGIVHVIDGVITPGQYSIKELINESKNLTFLKKIIENEDLAKLFDREGSFTFLAPTDAAFEKLDAMTKKKLLNGDSCAYNILKYHIILHTICSAAINGNVTVHNIERKMFDLERKDDDSIIIEGNVKITKADVIATDGVIHLVDTLLLPDSGLHVTQVLKKHNQTKFEELIETADLVEEIDSTMNATIFVPTDEALEDPDTIQLINELKDNPERLKEVIMYHIVPEKIHSCDLKNNDLKQTNNDNQKLRVNLYSTLPLFSNILNRGTVNCARLVNIDEKSCGTVIHTVDKLLIPPKKTILDIINEEERFSILRKLIKDTEVEEILKDETQSVTLLAPTDDIFEKNDEVMNELLDDKEKATHVLKKHILSEVLCCSGVGPKHWSYNSFVPNLNHQSEEIRRNHQHEVVIGSATVTKCDKVATNGVIHEVNHIMVRQKPKLFQLPRFDGAFFFDF